MAEEVVTVPTNGLAVMEVRITAEAMAAIQDLEVPMVIAAVV